MHWQAVPLRFSSCWTSSRKEVRLLPSTTFSEGMSRTTRFTRQ